MFKIKLHDFYLFPKLEYVFTAFFRVLPILYIKKKVNAKFTYKVYQSHDFHSHLENFQLEEFL